MDNRYKYIVVLMLCIGLLATPAIVVAQNEEEMTLENLAQTVQDLTARLDIVDALDARIKLLEAVWGSPGPHYTEGSVCEIAGTIQDITVVKHKETFDEWPNVDRINVQGVAYDEETGLTSVLYSYDYPVKSVVEQWNGCEFVDVSDWQEE